MHSNNMKQIGIQNGPAGPIFAHSMELWNFQSRLGPGPRDDVTALTLEGFQLSTWKLRKSHYGLKFGGMMQLSSSLALYEMATLS